MVNKLVLLIYLGLLTIMLQAQQLAFPGATGFGRYAIGGRGGTVYHVTNLNDGGAGSLRDAVSQPNRIVVFDVAGIINIQSRIVFSKNLTIAGQTAPGEGVVVYGNGVSFSGAENIICRYMRFRMGAGGDSGKDAATIANGQNMIFDHVSVTWGLDETFSISWDKKGVEPTNITIQNSIIGQGLQTHSCGGLIETSGGVTLFRNLYIDNDTRNPKVKGLNQFVNNVVYNWGDGGCYILGGSEGTSWATIVNNYFIEGPNSSVSVYSRANENFQLYATGNIEDANRDGNLNGVYSVKGNYDSVFWVDNPQYWADVADSDLNKIPQMHPEIPEMMTAEEAYNWVVDSVGCTLPVRDQVDLLLIDELTSLGKKGVIIGGEKELSTGGPGEIYSGNKLQDTDNDGMPDVWEDANGTEKTVNDAGIIGADGYSNIEKYINSITEQVTEPNYFVKIPVNISAIAKTTSTITLKWTNPQDDLTAIIIEYGINEIFSNSVTVEGNATTAIIEGLASNTKYYFRLKSVEGNLESDYSEVFSMTTSGEVIPPVSCVNPTPAIGAVIDQTRNIVLKWENPTGVMAGTLYFDIFLGKSENSMVQIAAGITQYQNTISELEENTTYYWKVKTTNLLGVDDGVVWSFSTGEPIQRNMVLYLPFDETSGNVAIDKIHQAEATAFNFAPIWGKGMVENSVYFPGTPVNQNMTVDYYDDLFLDNQSFTISFWFKSPGGIADSYLFHKGMHDLTNGGNGHWIGLQYRGTTLTFGIDDNSKKSTVDISAANKWFNNKWHLISCIRDVENDLLKVYIDGRLEKEVTDGTGAIGETGNLILGNRNGYFDNPYIGNLDELKIFDSALTANEIKIIYDDATNSGTGKLSISDFDVFVFPNPFLDWITFQLPQDMDCKTTLKILTASGVEVYKENFDEQTMGAIPIYLKQLPSGLYFCIVSNSGKQAIRKIIKY